MRKKPLPQFGSRDEAVEFYSQYGKLEYQGRLGLRAEEYLYKYDVIDGRRMTLVLYEDGRVREIPK